MKKINYLQQRIHYDNIKNGNIDDFIHFKNEGWTATAIEGYLLDDVNLTVFMLQNEIDRMLFFLSMAIAEIENDGMSKDLFEGMKLDIQNWYEMDLFKYLNEDEAESIKSDVKTVKHYIGKHWDEY